MLLTLIGIVPLYFLAWFIARLCLRDKILQASVKPSAKYWQIDGLRFFLAFSVFLHHMFIMRQYRSKGIWSLTEDRVVTFLGQGGVSLFFIITAFLFWDKALKKPNSFNAVEFLAGRIRRLAPAYLLVAVPFLILSLAPEPVFEWALVRQVFQSLALGFFGPINIGSLNLSPAYVGVFWTLFYEWRFYFLLPALYIIFNFNNYLKISSLLCLIVLLISAFVDTQISRDWPYISLFASGILAANIYNSAAFHNVRINHIIVDVLFILSLFVNLVSSDTFYGTNKPIMFLITFVFLLKLHPESLVGRILKDPATILLGNASYSTYVIHGFIISLTVLPFAASQQGMSALNFMLFAVVSTLFVSLLSLAAYRYVELPFAFRPPSPRPSGVIPNDPNPL